MGHPARHSFTFGEYLELEEVAGVRHEYLGGDIYAMAGGTPEHAAMAAAILLQLGEQLRGSPCQTFSSDLRIRILATGLATYPDVSVVCGGVERDPESATHVTNPKVVVEVLSPATAGYDRREKLTHYQTVPSLEAILLVDHLQPSIELWTRTATGREGTDSRESTASWEKRTFSAGSRVPLPAIQCSLNLDEIYAAAVRVRGT